MGQLLFAQTCTTEKNTCCNGFEDTMKALYPFDLYREKYVKHNTCRPKMNTSSWSINVLENCLKWYSILLVFRHNTIWQWCNNKQTNKTLGRLRYHFSFLLNRRKAIR